MKLRSMYVINSNQRLGLVFYQGLELNLYLAPSHAVVLFLALLGLAVRAPDYNVASGFRGRVLKKSESSLTMTNQDHAFNCVASY